MICQYEEGITDSGIPDTKNGIKIIKNIISPAMLRHHETVIDEYNNPMSEIRIQCIN
jgi:hypothetical protein